MSTLPDGVTFGSAATDQGACSFANGVVTCALGTLPFGGAASARILVTPSGDSPTPLTFSATIESTQVDVNPTNNQDTLNVTVLPAIDLSVTPSVSPAQVLAGDNLAYRFTVANDGLSPANNVTLPAAMKTGQSWCRAAASASAGKIIADASTDKSTPMMKPTGRRSINGPPPVAAKRVSDRTARVAPL